ncbi:glycine-rich protein 2-like [Pyrus ussuriensis x Pyrus communis]|uniref:Glycine-rich protein 2-like n=1 Tax=Pyrus ussuriensis x Pyrus communis TaxID=2448454 RepID=A0A5N5FFQ7_9ROSA|nr:glycine-rich protein 2-like [Pyrus ussuriensis x Pyrus communis]
MSERLSGTVKWFNDQKGFGFITPNDGGKDLFVTNGEMVEYTVEKDADGRTKAVNMTGPENGLVQGSRDSRGDGYGGGGYGSGSGGYSLGGGYGGGGGAVAVALASSVASLDTWRETALKEVEATEAAMEEAAVAVVEAEVLLEGATSAVRVKAVISSSTSLCLCGWCWCVWFLLN